jgi:hypothetical protein
LNDTFWLAKIFHYSEKYFQADAVQGGAGTYSGHGAVGGRVEGG